MLGRYTSTSMFIYKQNIPISLRLSDSACLFYLRHKHIINCSCLSDFMTFSEHFNIQSEGSIFQLWNTVGI